MKTAFVNMEAIGSGLMPACVAAGKEILAVCFSQRSHQPSASQWGVRITMIRCVSTVISVLRLVSIPTLLFLHRLMIGARLAAVL